MPVQIGTSLPITEFGPDLNAVRDFAQAADDMGYKVLSMLDHVLGADPQYHPEVANFYYTHESYIHEPFTLMGYLAAITNNITMGTSIMILAQRQTSLVAKQAAEVDVLSGGRIRLGIGVGWNPVEYEALGEDFHTRGRKFEEQIEVLRLLWTQEKVNYQGRFHTITEAGINPLPVQRPIPLWIGQGNPHNPVPREHILRRIGRMADGMFPLFPPDDAGREVIDRIKGYAKEAGRDPDALGVQGRVVMSRGSNAEDWIASMKQWEGIGATYISVGTGGLGFESPQEHIDAIRRFKDEVGLD
jgi:probable F420-dependent oxidoreductase